MSGFQRRQEPKGYSLPWLTWLFKIPSLLCRCNFRSPCLPVWAEIEPLAPSDSIMLDFSSKFCVCECVLLPQICNCIFLHTPFSNPFFIIIISALFSWQTIYILKYSLWWLDVGAHCERFCPLSKLAHPSLHCLFIYLHIYLLEHVLLCWKISII